MKDRFQKLTQQSSFFKSFARFVLLIFVLTSCASLPKGAYEKGRASWYGKNFHGKKMANGAPYNMNAMTAAHPELSFGTRVKVVNQRNGRSVVVKITDRGPYSGGRIIDLSKAAARRLGFIGEGVAPVVLYIIGR